MATYNKINAFVGQLGLKAYNLNTDQLNLALARDTDAPTAADTVLSNITEVTGSGYTAGGSDSTNLYSATGGTGTMTGVSLMWTAGGAWNSFQYPILHNVTVSNQLVAWWDYGSALTLASGETFSAKFSNAAVGVAGNIFTLT